MSDKEKRYYRTCIWNKEKFIYQRRHGCVGFRCFEQPVKKIDWADIAKIVNIEMEQIT